MIVLVVGIVGLMTVGQVEPLPHLYSLTEQLRGPARLAVAPDGSILVTDPPSRQIVRFDSSGSLVNVWPVSEGPIGVAVHPDGRIFVSMRDEPKVAVFDSTFGFLEYLGEDEPLVTFSGPTDIDIATDTGRIYVVDATGDRVFGFHDDGSLALILGSRGSRPGEYLYPSAITVDEPRNRIIIADHDTFRFQMFTTAGVFLQQFGDRLTSTNGILEGWMPRPLGVSVDANGRIYASDALMGTVRVFNSIGVELGKVVAYGEEPGGLRIPCDLAVSGDGRRLYVASTGSSRVEVYDLTGIAMVGADGASTVDPVLQPPGAPDDMHGSVAVESALQTLWDGPHLVDDRPDLCAPCHGIRGQPGTHAGTVEGQGILCMSCHTPGGRAQDLAILQRDVADPFGTNASAADGLGRSHAWGVPAVNELAGAVAPRPGGTMSSYLDVDGNIKCATCHNQHDDGHVPYLRVSNEGDAMCKECHAPRDAASGEGGSHPVGVLYPDGEGEYPASGDLAPLYIKEGMVECMSCHAIHGADSGGANAGEGDGMLLRTVNDETLCRTCHAQHVAHNVAGDWQPTCDECHAVHDDGNENVALIAWEIDGAPVRFTEGEGACGGRREYVRSICDPPSYDGVCEVCHTDTDYHLGSPKGDHAHAVDLRCTACHPHRSGFLPSGATCAACHGEPPDGTVFPNRAGSHAAHLSARSGPNIAECSTCHLSEEGETHMDGVASFASGVDVNGDGRTDLAEADVCDDCHSKGGPIDGVNDPVVGAKTNWTDGVYDGDVLKPDKVAWCSGCHDSEGAIVDGVTAPPVAGDGETWGDSVAGHGRHHIVCTDCHDPTLAHTDGEPRTFRLQFPLTPGGITKTPEEREADRDAYNDGYRLRRIDGARALEIPRDLAEYTADDFRLCYTCHDEVKLMGVPIDHEFHPVPPPYLQLPVGVAQTNYRNESPWGFFWEGQPRNAHWRHTAQMLSNWNIDHDAYMWDSTVSCVTCHNPHGARKADGEPTIGMTVVDLDITEGVYNDGVTDWEYAYIGSDDFHLPGGDLHCQSCHPFSGGGGDPPMTGLHTRYYRGWLDLWPEECMECHDDGG